MKCFHKKYLIFTLLFAASLTYEAYAFATQKNDFFRGTYNPERYADLDALFGKPQNQEIIHFKEKPMTIPEGKMLSKDPWLRDIPSKESAQNTAVKQQKPIKKQKGRTDLSGSISAETRLFTGAPALNEQKFGSIPSFAFESEYAHISANEKHTYVIKPFLRIDPNDKDREHADLREAFWHYEADDWELKLGADKVFWGVTESNHLVDVINQTDLVESLDGEEKLGQPMIQLGRFNDWGTVRLFILPMFRERTYPGPEGRLRGPLAINIDNAQYESNNKRHNIDAALRYTHTLGDWDIGLAHFSGTSREPAFTAGLAPDGQLVATPTYHLMDQTSIDLQLTTEATLYKLEAFSRETQGERFEAISAGVEYTFYDIRETGLDLGLLAEYHRDARPFFLPVTQLDNDTFLAVRITANDINDKQVLIGVIIDNDTKNRIYSAEYSQRLGDNYRLEIEGSLFAGQADPTAIVLGEDDYVVVRLTRYF